jgi:hypothetical protein
MSVFNVGPQRGPSSSARIEAQSRAIRRELDELAKEPMFVCKKCGSVSREADRCDITKECIYC